ncbi:ABC transporter ATP-binding protein [Halorubrum sp. F4]|uniref:ABC transporter ATP-binding protein n=1 Tax=Halorubrum sp. F4 TaxID=2989715 RepID=UPI0024804493|nr:ABC transporter ATP-binding protein [Halorubrum sp. F4]
MSEPLLRTDSVTKRFGKLTAVSDVSLSIPEGGISSIIGPNGAGKTTLFNLFTGKHAPTEGSIEFRGDPIDGLEPHEVVARGIVRSFQITNFFAELSALENVRLATQADRTGFAPDDFLAHHASLSEATDEAEAVLERIGLLDVADRTAANLAYGERRHLEIGIALATDPDLLLMDEPTAGMGPEQTDATVSLIENIAEDATVVLIEHDMEIVMNVSERIAVMNSGELIARGTPEEISRNEAVQRAYLGGE